MNIGNLEIKGKVALAPMAGVADRAMREICMGYGAAFCVGELTSARGVYLNDKKSEELLYVSEKERPMGVQLFGYEPEIMAEAAVKSMIYRPDFIDINMGCPAPKVANNRGGSGLLKDLPLAEKIVSRVVKAVDIPVTVKMRIGWDENSFVADELARACESAGAKMITVHGRTREQKYAPPVDINSIARVKKAVKIPVVGNGDITDIKSAARMFEETGCDMIMVGRGAMGHPWIFQQLNAYLDEGRIIPEPPLSQKMLVLSRQAELMQKYRDPHIAFLNLRKHTAWYIKGLPGAAKLREKCFGISCKEDFYAIIKEVLETCRDDERN